MFTDGATEVRQQAAAVASLPVPRRIGRILCDDGHLTPLALREALAEQARLDAPLGEILLAKGLISPDALLSALAQQCGWPVAQSPPAPQDNLLELLPATEWLALGAVPWSRSDDTLTVALSRPHDLEAVTAALPTSLTITPLLATPQMIEDRLHQLFGAALARRAETRVPEDYSCRTFDRWQGTRANMSLLLLSGLLIVLLDPLSAALLLIGWTILTLGAVSLLKSACTLAFLVPRKAPAPQPMPKNMPRISTMIALYKEPEVVPRLISHMRDIDYPAALLDVLFVLEEADTATRQAFEDARPLPHGFRVITVPEGHPKTKPRALNYALDFCRGEIIGIYDAEDMPEPAQLRQVARQFANTSPEVVCLQGVLDYFNPRENWLARCFTAEYAGWFRLVLPGMARLNLPLPLGGTTLFFRRDALEQLGGWDAHNVTEDADLGMRLARFGWRTDLLASHTLEEANCHLWPWIKQRSRWIKGYMVTYLVHMRAPLRLLRDLGLLRFVWFQVFFLATISQFLLAPLLWTFWLIPFGVHHPIEAATGAGLLTSLSWVFIGSEVLNMFSAALATKGPQHRHLWPWIPTMVFYFPLASVAAAKALYEMIFSPFYWDKTTHGISKVNPKEA
ncbi:glycosyltransferase [Donghicola tyrosinivorans]|uniref:Cellulose synthase/poly-beta-1,6-N-acetylglucosamine synthase-like glycosyltransferase n=1 Tax=Donghicola tyrosinivorans TaxID=1652492 RepID=A0A2T0WX79_9RHOB|nr:glycosyltransferase [Donghicola tyrosinivorans]PRY91306.1 cellulose synthase/poly-beta-1,6-N-acetylglucosamine synthase-like glycosyltransferase [Donghicola tyrosinivorans]